MRILKTTRGQVFIVEKNFILTLTVLYGAQDGSETAPTINKWWGKGYGVEKLTPPTNLRPLEHGQIGSNETSMALGFFAVGTI